MTTDLLPDFIRQYYEAHECKHAWAILKYSNHSQTHATSPHQLPMI